MRVWKRVLMCTGDEEGTDERVGNADGRRVPVERPPRYGPSDGEGELDDDEAIV
jgi:hypothetical protein